jgi:hypothetical protein
MHRIYIYTILIKIDNYTSHSRKKKKKKKKKKTLCFTKGPGGVGISNITILNNDFKMYDLKKSDF